MTAIASGAPTLRAPAMVSNASCVSEGLRELTDEELDLVAGACFGEDSDILSLMW
jgi:hypothetical protein